MSKQKHIKSVHSRILSIQSIHTSSDTSSVAEGESDEEEGGGDEKAFWAQPENDEVLDGISDLVVTVNNKEGSTAFLDYVNLGINAKFAAKLADALT